MLLPGEVLDKRYRLDHRIATGGMGDVWRATDTVLSRPVAVKVMLPALLSDPGFAARFRAEARMMATLRHPGVVQVYDYGQSTVTSGDVVYLVMSYVDGEPLSNRMAAAGRLPVAETLNLTAQAADALQAVHDGGIVHRDVKPANLLVQPDGTVVLVDFGVAHSSTAATRLTGTGTVLGTALYMAPEQVSGGAVSGATDVYALGALAYHCLAGRPPFEGENALQVAVHHLHDEPPPLPDDVPAPVRALVGRALAKDPADRYPSAAAFAQAARAVLGGADAATVALGDLPTRASVPVAAATVAAGPATLHDLPTTPGPAPSPPGGPDRTARRAALIAAAVAVPVLIALVALAVAFWPSGNANTPGPIPSTVSSRPAAPTATAPAGEPGTQTTRPTQGPTRTAAPPTGGPTATRTTAPTAPPAPTTTTNPGGGTGTTGTPPAQQQKPPASVAP